MSLLSGSPPRTRATSASKFTVLESGPWHGVWDSPDPGVDPKKFLADATNVVFRDSRNTGPVYERQLFDDVWRTTYGGGNAIQGTGSFHGSDGVLYNFVIANGNLYVGTNIPSNVAIVLSGGCTISSSADQVYLAALGNKVVVNDLTNQPFYYDPVTGTMAKLQIDGAATVWHATAKQTVYGGSMFFVDTTGRAVWSEANDVTTGYSQSPFTNSWTLEQTGTGQLTGLCGTNRGLLYFRRDSVGLAIGAVGSSTFSTTATHAAISDSIGTRASGSIIAVGETVFFVDTASMPWMIAPSGELVPIWRAARTTLLADAAVGTKQSVSYLASFSPDPHVVVFRITLSTKIYVFDVETGHYWGRWTTNGDATITSLGVIRAYATGDRLPPVLVVGCSDGTIDFLHELTEGTPFPAVTFSVTTRQLGWTLSGTFTVDLVQIAVAPSDAAVNTYRGTFSSTLESQSLRTGAVGTDPAGSLTGGLVTWGTRVVGRYFVGTFEPLGSNTTQRGIFRIMARARVSATTSTGIV